MNTIQTRNFHTDYKIKARQKSVIDFYRSCGKNSLPIDQEYWSMCAQCSENNLVIPGCEFDHVVKEGLIKPHQFHGVELHQEIANENAKLSEGHFYHGDFTDKFIDNASNPGLINIDHHKTWKSVAQLLFPIINWVNASKLSPLVIVNMVYKCMFYEEEFVKEIHNLVIQLQPVLQGWAFDKEYYNYKGIKNNNSTGMVTFYLKKSQSKNLHVF